MAALTVKAAAEELAAALTVLAEPILDAGIVLLAISKVKFSSRNVERELAVAISNAAASFRKATREHAETGNSILRGVREFHARALALAEQEDESNDQG